MNKKTFRILEFDKIIEQLAALADSEPGKRLCLRLTPKSDPEKIRLMQKQTSDALARLLRGGSTSFGSNKDIGFITKHLSIGGSLNSEELLLLAGLLENVARVKQYDRSEDQTDSLSELFNALEPLTNLSTEVRRCILGPDEFANDASPALKDIRRKINHTQDKIHSQLNSMVNGSLRTYLMDAVITMRGDRYCLPVKAEYKSHVPGMVHDQSSTGSTFFIEPAAIVDLNNKLKELAIAEKEEISKILLTLSAEFMPYSETIGENARLMTRLDFIFAKGRLALEQNATEPDFSDNTCIHIRKGRHPLLNKKTVVPIDIYLGEGFDQLIITGPNTGGKTVSLKTVGLLSLMAQSGLHIPALDRSKMRIFKNVFADIGDEQSIEQSLSTFSSHMTNIVSILQHADSDSLCLFDELCSGTDPTEGAALAISILTRLHKQHVFTMATTHYSELKLYALSADGVENASCEFDGSTAPRTDPIKAPVRVFLKRYTPPATSTKDAPSKKLLSSPTPPVVVINRCSTFLIRQMITPATGPYAKEPIKAGSSDKSILMKLGINGTEKSKNINTYAMADSIAVPVSLRMLTFFFVPLLTVTCVVFSLMSVISFQMNAYLPTRQHAYNI